MKTTEETIMEIRGKVLDAMECEKSLNELKAEYDEAILSIPALEEAVEEAKEAFEDSRAKAREAAGLAKVHGEIDKIAARVERYLKKAQADLDKVTAGSPHHITPTQLKEVNEALAKDGDYTRYGALRYTLATAVEATDVIRKASLSGGAYHYSEAAKEQLAKLGKSFIDLDAHPIVVEARMDLTEAKEALETCQRKARAISASTCLAKWNETIPATQDEVRDWFATLARQLKGKLDWQERDWMQLDAFGSPMARSRLPTKDGFRFIGRKRRETQYVFAFDEKTCNLAGVLVHCSQVHGGNGAAGWAQAKFYNGTGLAHSCDTLERHVEAWVEML